VSACGRPHSAETVKDWPQACRHPNLRPFLSISPVEGVDTLPAALPPVNLLARLPAAELAALEADARSALAVLAHPGAAAGAAPGSAAALFLPAPPPPPAAGSGDGGGAPPPGEVHARPVGAAARYGAATGGAGIPSGGARRPNFAKSSGMVAVF